MCSIDSTGSGTPSVSNRWLHWSIISPIVLSRAFEAIARCAIECLNGTMLSDSPVTLGVSTALSLLLVKYRKDLKIAVLLEIARVPKMPRHHMLADWTEVARVRDVTDAVPSIDGLARNYIIFRLQLHARAAASWREHWLSRLSTRWGTRLCKNAMVRTNLGERARYCESRK